MKLINCRSYAMAHPMDCISFELCGPNIFPGFSKTYARAKCRWVDPVLGTFTMAGKDDIFNSKDFEKRLELWCEKVKIE
jgi:hypothetical protein